MHNTPLRDIPSVFLGASKVILDAVVYFRLLAFAIDILHYNICLGKLMIRQKVGWHVSPQSATAQYHTKPFAQ